ncbi:MAG: DUF4278 domain-containing protein [Merismopedia sp. SIO2A8]|nr:DUF4278 domain-containing protein [Symploca sp. SIO2B6]NET53463.1 DUF4278 domain-containing protein [Merismopedia sp. SIO2A8]
MLLTYRGQKAKPSNVANTIKTGVDGTFRGQHFPIRSIQTPIHCDKTYLQYRGVIYESSRT